MPRTTKRQALQAPPPTGPVDVHFYPRSFQWPAWEAMTDKAMKRAMLIWPRGAGKDLISLWIIWYWMIKWPGQYFHVFTSYGQAKRGIWDASYEIGGKVVKYLDIFPPALIDGDPSVSELQIKLKPIPPHTVGSIYQMIGAENADAIRGTHPNGVILSEYRDMRPQVWDEIVEPALMARDGFAIFASTPRGRNHLYDLYEAVKTSPEWFVQRLDCTVPRRDAEGEPGDRVYSEERIAQYRLGKDEATVQQELFCSFEGNLEGAVYAREMAAAEAEGRISDFPIRADLPCGTMWDLGFSDATTCIIYQTDGRWIDIVDYLEATRTSSAEMAALLKQRPYTFARHTMPWDVEQQHDGQTRREAFERLGVRPIVVAPKDEIREGLDRVRRFFPRFRFHRTKCAKLIEALKNYRYEWDEAKQEYKPKPLHDKWSHGADALRAGIMGWIEGLGFSEPPKWTHAEMAFDLFTHARHRPAEREADMAVNLFAMR